MFYAVTQRGLDKWNGSFFCGSAALLRRQALDEAGGFSGITITEDCETAFELHSRGWTSAYVDKPLIAGLQPDTLTDFIGQRVGLVPGHVPDPAPEESGPAEGPQADPEGRLPVEHDVLVLPGAAADLHVRAAAAHLLRPEDLRRQRR
jgi:hypothetical protein